MTIEEYKKKLISVVENMELEYGFDIENVWIHNLSTDENGVKKFKVEIEM